MSVNQRNPWKQLRWHWWSNWGR